MNHHLRTKKDHGNLKRNDSSSFSTMAPQEEPSVDTDDRNNAEINEEKEEVEPLSSSSTTMSLLKLAASCAFLFSAVSTLTSSDSASDAHRRLTQQAPIGDIIPSYMKPLMTELKTRTKLMLETPAEEVKYWFEYTGELQVS